MRSSCFHIVPIKLQSLRSHVHSESFDHPAKNRGLRLEFAKCQSFSYCQSHTQLGLPGPVSCLPLDFQKLIKLKVP